MHYKTEFHRFNLRRKVAGLPHISQAVFDEKVKQVETEKNLKNATPEAQYCKVCRKKFGTPNAFKSHLSSKRHVQLEQQAKSSPADSSVTSPLQSPEVSSPLADDDTSSSATPPPPPARPQPPKPLDEMTDEELIHWRFQSAVKLDPNQNCLFCTTLSENIEENLKHMSLYHRFRIPYFEYLVDPHAFLTYLGQKISVGFLCLYCNEKGRSFHSLASVRDHMRSLHHCKLGYDDDEDEYSRFYDFTSSYEPLLLTHGAAAEGDSEVLDDSASPSTSSSSSAPSSSSSSSSSKPIRKTVDLDDDDAEDPIYEEIVRRAKKNVKVSECGTQLIFASGQVAGHRAFQLYHRQKFHVGDTRDAVLIGRMMDHYRKHGYMIKHRDEKLTKEVKTIQSIEKKMYMQLGVKANILQHHFRHQNPK